MSEAKYESLRAVAGPVSRETFLRLEVFESQFRHWARRINLAAPSTMSEIWDRHVLDSAQLLPLAEEADFWLDLGSGGGFPGAIIAILLADRPGASIDLVESNGKKAAFLQTVLSELKVPARIHRRRIEDCVGLGTPDVVTARALAPLPRLLNLASPWLTTGARGLFHKGRDYGSEVEESLNHWRFDLIQHADKVDAQGIILEIVNLRRIVPKQAVR